MALATLLAAVLMIAAVVAPTAVASTPWWKLNTSMEPAKIGPSGETTLVLLASNLGDAPTSGPITITATLPPAASVVEREVEGVEVPQVSFFAFPFAAGGTDLGIAGPLGFLEMCHLSGAQVICRTEPANPELAGLEFGSPLNPYETLELRVRVKDESSPEEAVKFEVSGGSATPAGASQPLLRSDAPVPFGAEALSLVPEEEGGHLDTRAGSHPFQLTTVFDLNQNENPVRPPALPRNLRFKLPAGQVANLPTVPRCSAEDFATTVPVANGTANRCPSSTAIGVATITFDEPNNFNLRTFSVPLFNLEPARGEPARFGFVFVQSPVILETSVRSGPGDDYGVTVTASNITQLANLLSSTVTFWGTPGDPRHQSSRGWDCLMNGYWAAEPGLPCAPTSEPSPRAFLTLPTDCEAPFATTVEGASWPSAAFPTGATLEPLTYFLQDEAGNLLGLTGCNQLPFKPQIAAQPTAGSAASSSGLNFDLDFPNEGLENAAGSAESAVRRVTVALPRGVTTNPAVANGLSACTRAQYEAEAIDGQSCPESSKIGEVEIESPLVEEEIDGAIYVAKQHDNPADNLLSIYMVAKNPKLGVLVRSAGAVTPDPQTGQLTTTFGLGPEPLPQLPFSHFHLSFRSGARAPLITPDLCGVYTTQADLYPYANPTVPMHREATFQVKAGANGAPCATQESQLPNDPSLEAGTTSPIAGAYAPFLFKVKRNDGSQVLSRIDATLPEGLLGKLAGVKECSGAEIAQAEGRSGEGQGALELASPSCPAASQVGVVNVGTGVGPQPYYVQGKAYLAGPYKGAPLSLAIITPAVVGPFDLGTIVVRTALYVDEQTAQITAKSDPIPTIVHGLPTVVQSIALNMDRPDFTLNPTSCEPKQITGSALSTLGGLAPLSQRFQVGACGALGFKPTLKLSLKGATKRSGVPALKAVLTYPKGDYANIKSVSTVLPKSEYIDQAHIGNVCTRVQFSAGAGQGAGCPKRSVLGHAKAWSPLLDKPLEGTVYLRSNGSERELPDIVVALKGQIPVTLVGFVDSVQKSKNSEVSRIRTRFVNVPDAPVSRFVLQLAGAKHGLLENSANLCRVKNVAQVKMTAQNGKTYDTSPAVANDCGKKARHGNHKRSAGR